MDKQSTIIKALLKNNLFIIKNKRLNLEIIIDDKQKDGINVKYSLYNSEKTTSTSNSKQLQQFLKNAYYNATARKDYQIPWIIAATLKLPKIKINETILANTATTINNLQSRIIEEGITIKNYEINYEVKLSLPEILENFHIEDCNLKELLNDCLKISNNSFEQIKQQSNLITNQNEIANYPVMFSNLCNLQK